MKKGFICLLLGLAHACMSLASSLLLYDLRCENLSNPLAVDNSLPHFSWKITGRQPMRQCTYEIQVATDSLGLTKGNVNLWDSGQITSDHSVMVPYKGKELKSRMLCYWRVRVGNEQGEQSAWSSIQRFAIGILDNKLFNGKYIGLAQGDVRSPLLRKSFVVEQKNTTFLHVNSLGYHEVYINGRKADSQVLSPAVSQLDKRSLIVTYDITPFLSQGENDLVIWLGQGWYKKPGHFKAQYEGPVVKAEISVLDNGKWETLVKTDRTWTGCESGYTDMGTWKALHFGGERIDARMVPYDLTPNELDKRQWGTVTEVDIREHIASPQMCEPNRIQETLIPKSITPLDKDTWLVDMGKVLTGWFELRVPQLPAGHEILVFYSDYMNEDGEIEEQGESDLYIVSGSPGGDVFRNKFHYHAFRYVKIVGLPYKPESKHIKAHLIHGDYQAASTFICSDKDLNAIHDMINYTLRCLTFSGYMVDCPHLERMGYGGDGNSSTQTVQTMYDVSPTYLNWMQAWKDAMREGGSLPHTAPCGGGGGGPYWCGFVVMAPWWTYINYNDSRFLERFYDTMKEWMGYVEQYRIDGLLKRWPDTSYRSWFLGDWLAPKGVDYTNPVSIDLVNNCFISECFDIMSKAASVLGKTEDATAFANKKTELNALIHKTFYKPNEKKYATGSQLDMIYPMLAGAVPDKLYPLIANNLKRHTAEQNAGHIGVGLVGVPVLTEWAIRNKETDFMYNMLKKQDYPGYLYMLDKGATTTWEYWHGERSRIHNCYNGIGTWFYQAVGGIRVDESQPGYKHIFIDPQIPEGVTWAKVSKETPFGTVYVGWRLEGNKLELNICLPVGVTADVITPKNATESWLNKQSINTSNKSLQLDNGSNNCVFKF